MPGDWKSNYNMISDEKKLNSEMLANYFDIYIYNIYIYKYIEHTWINKVQPREPILHNGIVRGQDRKFDRSILAWETIINRKCANPFFTYNKLSNSYGIENKAQLAWDRKNCLGIRENSKTDCFLKIDPNRRRCSVGFRGLKKKMTISGLFFIFYCSGELWNSIPRPWAAGRGPRPSTSRMLQ